MSPMPKLVRGERGASILGVLVVALMLGAGAVATVEMATPPLSSVSGDSQLAGSLAAKVTKRAAPSIRTTTCTTIRACNLQSKKIGDVLSEACVPGFIYKLSLDNSDAVMVTAVLNPAVASAGPCNESVAPPAQKKNPAAEEAKNILTCDGDQKIITGHIKPGVSATCVVEDCREKGFRDSCRTLALKGGTKFADAKTFADRLEESAKLAKDLDDTGANIERLNRCVSPGDLAGCIGVHVPNEFLSNLKEEGEERRKNLRNCYNAKRGSCTSETYEDTLFLLTQQKNKADATAKDMHAVDGEIADLAHIAAAGPPRREDDENTAGLEIDPTKRTAKVCVGGVCRTVTVPAPGPDPRRGPAERDNNNTFGGGAGSGGLADLLKLLTGQQQKQPSPGNQTPQSPNTCLGGQTLCSGNTLYSRNNQCVDTVVQYCQYGCSGNSCAQQQQQTQQGITCPQAQAQPNPLGCTNGSWRPTYTGACLSGWQCVPTGGGVTITAQLSCLPQVADTGMTIAISYACSSGASEGSGFDTGGAQSGTASTTIQNLPSGTNTAIYGLKCSDGAAVATKQCSIQVAKPAIVLMANPKVVQSGKTSAIGWVTSGMHSCVISSPNLQSFTDEHKNVTNVNGSVVTPPLSSASDFVLKCATVGGNFKAATTTVTIQ